MATETCKGGPTVTKDAKIMFKFWTATSGARQGVANHYRRSASVLSFNHDGLEIARVKTHRRRWLPFWHLLVFIYLVLLIRLVVLADLGPVGYAARMNEMNNGTLLERGAAKIMQMDPYSQQLAVRLRKAMNFINGDV